MLLRNSENYCRLDNDQLVLLTSDDLIVVFFFFFQAEDGIRDLTVTGVQTCALPISGTGESGRHLPDEPHRHARNEVGMVDVEDQSRRRMIPRVHDLDHDLHLLGRSEEHTSELQSQSNLVCRLLLEKKKKKNQKTLIKFPKNSNCPFITVFFLHSYTIVLRLGE